jgi:hypothetical protein
VGQAGPGVPQVVAVFAVCYVGPALARTFATALGLLAAPLACAIILWWLDGFEEIAIARGRLTWRRGVLGLSLSRIRTVRLDEVVEIRPTPWPRRAVLVRLRGGDAIPVGAGLGHRPETLDWLHRRLDHALRPAAE